jgi:hypothetical protein
MTRDDAAAAADRLRRLRCSTRSQRFAGLLDRDLPELLNRADFALLGGRGHIDPKNVFAAKAAHAVHVVAIATDNQPTVALANFKVSFKPVPARQIADANDEEPTVHRWPPHCPARNS